MKFETMGDYRDFFNLISEYFSSETETSKIISIGFMNMTVRTKSIPEPNFGSMRKSELFELVLQPVYTNLDENMLKDKFGYNKYDVYGNKVDEPQIVFDLSSKEGKKRLEEFSEFLEDIVKKTEKDEEYDDD